MAGLPLSTESNPRYSPAMTGSADQAPLAVARYIAPHGPEAAVLHAGDVVPFGRGGDCTLRFAFAPTADHGVPRVAGWLVVANNRIIVEAAESRSGRSLQLVSAGRPPMLLGCGEAFAPSGHQFTVIVHGEQATWPIHITVVDAARTRVQTIGGEPTRRFHLQLTETQHAVISAYVEPMRRGRFEPATHREVADQLSYHPNSVREVLYEVWATLLGAGIPMPDISDKRVAVSEAVLLHQLLDER